eukprot:m.176415 g.176415  ORF g.176415 m.176415 type:complete len:95 (+) comp10430_c0_seq2:2710-2994(+)
MAPSRLDTIARAAQRAVPMLQFFRLGWGDPAQMESLRRVAAEQFKSHRAMSSIPQPEITLSKACKAPCYLVWDCSRWSLICSCAEAQGRCGHSV